jgi:ABC-2 type transport system ATP-binding protein
VSGNAIEVRDLRKSYGALEALRGISFEVRRGEVFGLLGPNGAGKTTTVEILEGYRDRDGGEATVLGTDPASRAREFRERIGIVLQSAGFYPRATVRESVELMAKAYPAPRDVAETIALVGLSGKADARVKTLSGGQQRRLDLALALVGDPELIFLDEPTTGFDPAARRTAWDVVRSLRDLGKTVVLTTHYLDEAAALSDRVAIVQAGRIVAAGPPAELTPASRTYRVSYTRDGDRIELDTDDPTELLHRLTAEALRRGERLEDLTVTRPSLEDVYLELTSAAAEVGRGGGPVSAVALAWSQFRFERRNFWRNPSAAFFNFMLPLLFLVLIAAVYGSGEEALDVLVPGLAGMAVMSTTFTGLAYNMTFLREQGILKRVRGTPVPAPAYFGGVVANAVLNAAVQIALVIGVGHLAFGGDLPKAWLTLAVFALAGVATFACLGIAFAQLIPNFDAAPAYTNAVFLPLIFISGVFYSSDSMPRVLEIVADVLPLKHVIDGLHAAIVTGDGIGAVADGLAILAAWFAIGAWAIARRFRWEA